MTKYAKDLLPNYRIAGNCCGNCAQLYNDLDDNSCCRLLWELAGKDPFISESIDSHFICDKWEEAKDEE